MSLIGYDLDGVICPDVYWDGDFSKEGIKRLHKLREHIYPITRPKGDFYIITARPVDDKEQTLDWLHKNKIYPVDVIFSNFDEFTLENIVNHKSHYINSLKLKLFIESDINQVTILKNKCKCPVIHFENIIHKFCEGF